MCKWSLDLIFKAKLKLKSGNRKIQYGCQAAMLKVTSRKISSVLPVATKNMHVKFEIQISKQTWFMLQKPRCLQTDGRTRLIQYTPYQWVCISGYPVWFHASHIVLASVCVFLGSQGYVTYFTICTSANLCSFPQLRIVLKSFGIVLSTRK